MPFYREMPAVCSCLLGCTRCITGLSETANYVIYLVSHEWEKWVQNDQARLPIPGHKMLFRQGDQEMLCRVVKVSNCPSACYAWYLSHHASWNLHFQVTKGADYPNNSKYTSHPELALYIIRCPPDKTDLKPGEIMKVYRCPRNYLRFRRRKFPRSWAVWLVDHLNLVEGGVAEVKHTHVSLIMFRLLCPRLFHLFSMAVGFFPPYVDAEKAPRAEHEHPRRWQGWRGRVCAKS